MEWLLIYLQCNTNQQTNKKKYMETKSIPTNKMKANQTTHQNQPEMNASNSCCSLGTPNQSRFRWSPRNGQIMTDYQPRIILFVQKGGLQRADHTKISKWDWCICAPPTCMCDVAPANKTSKARFHQGFIQKVQGKCLRKASGNPGAGSVRALLLPENEHKKFF